MVVLVCNICVILFIPEVSNHCQQQSSKVALHLQLEIFLVYLIIVMHKNGQSCFISNKGNTCSFPVFSVQLIFRPSEMLQNMPV